jgi:hypothetical protein
MTYELAKQLKDAGFPRGDQLNTPHPQFFEDEAHEIPIRTPTLIELIAACGNRFYSVVRKKSGDTFYASDGDDWILPGSTPEEAVAKLWLALAQEKLIKENI